MMEATRQEVDQLTGMMRENVLKIQARGEKLEDLEVLSNDLEKNVAVFQTNAKTEEKEDVGEEQDEFDNWWQCCSDCDNIDHCSHLFSIKLTFI